MDALAENIRHHRRLYYNETPELSDESFDALENQLRKLAPNHPVFAEVGAAPPNQPASDEQSHPLTSKELTAHTTWLLNATQRAFEGDPADPKTYQQHYLKVQRSAPKHPALQGLIPARGQEWTKVAHEIPMGSLNKVNSETELRDWAKRCDVMADNGGLPPVSDALSIAEKLDGISIEVLYDQGKMEAAITRGDGTFGEQITPNVAHMQDVPSSIPYPARVSVRGEIILRKSDVGRYETLKKSADPKFEKVKSLRNTASGIARTKLQELSHAVTCLSILFYDVEGAPDLTTESDKHQWLKDQGFSTPFTGTGTINDILQIYQKYADGARAALDYEIDGLVIRAEQLQTFDLLGELNHRPRAAVAFKFSNEMEVSVVRAIEWNTGDTGRITPVARVDPVILAGAEVKQASLHNLGRIRELGIAVGDQVLVSRRNDVIPYVEQVVVPGGGREEAPTECSACGEPVTLDGEYVVCLYPHCPARRQGRVKTWLKQLGLLEWGEKTLERFFEEELVTEVADLYRLRVEDIISLHGFGEDSARKLLEPLQAKKSIPFPVFVAALGIPAVSKETAKLLVQAGFSSVPEVLAATTEQLSEIDGLGTIKAEKILQGLRERAEEIKHLEEVGVTPTRPEASGPLAGLSFCFSGSHQRPRKHLVQIVESNGGTVTSGVKKGLTYLVLADATSTSSKAQKARKLGTDIIDENGFEAVVHKRGGQIE